MMSSHVIRWWIITLATLFRVSVEARAACAPVPEKYRALEFAAARFAIEENCRRTFTRDEQFFLAGVAQHLRSTCRLPRDTERRALMDRFTSAAALSLDLQKRLHRGVASQRGGPAAFAAGMAMMDDIQCNGPEAALLARGIAVYLERSSGTSRFVEGCVELYAPRYAARDCRCVADALRPVLADVDERFFHRELIKQSIHESPRVALSLMLSCGVSDY